MQHFEVRERFNAKYVFNTVVEYIHAHRTLNLEEIFPNEQLADLKKAFANRKVSGMADLPTIQALPFTSATDAIVSLRSFLIMARLAVPDRYTNVLIPATPVPALV